VSFDGLFQRPVHLEVFARTDPGLQRSQNQDRFLVVDLGREGEDAPTVLEGGDESPEGGQFTEITLGRKGGVLLVADGMGGAAAGALASALAVHCASDVLQREWMMERNPVPKRFARALVTALEEASRVIHASAEENDELRGMGTTATAVGVLDGFLYAGQVGDSRAYLVRNGEAHQLTRDQSVVQSLMEAGTLSEEEAERSPHGNLILQALGTSPEVEVDLTYQQLRRGDVVLLCSDGLSGQVRRSEIARVIGSSPGLRAAGDRLVELANERGGPDNITVVLARAGGEGLREPGPGDVVTRTVWELEEP
jgi:protein phosphatase